MRSRAVRLTLFLLFVITVGSTAYLFYIGEARIRSESEQGREYEARVGQIVRDFDRLRTAQQAYVAAGQGDQFWASKVAAGLTELQGTLTALREASTADAARAALDNALAVLDDFSQMDRRAREYARNGQRLLASDLIFSDGFELTTAGVEAVRQAGAAERQARDEELAGVRSRQHYAIGSGAAAAVLVTLLLLPVGARADDEPGLIVRETRPADAGQEPTARATVADLSLEEGWSRATAASHPAEAPAAPPEVPLSPVAPAVELAPIASLCTDLARLADTRALPGLLERAAAALDASGIILWIADPDGQELAPIVTHGYPPMLVTRLGNIQREDQNATAAALRTSLLQTVKADAVSAGAIAAPLLTPAGCVGVMAAEVRQGVEEDPAKLAVATIVAAQLATLVGPPSTKAKAEAIG